MPDIELPLLRQRVDPRRRLRVLLLLDTLEPSGAEMSTLALIEPLIALGVDCHVGHFGGDGGLTDEFRAAGATVYTLARGRSRRSRTAAVGTLIDEVQPHLIHTTLFEADIAGRRAGDKARIPVISSIVNTAYGPTEIAASPAPKWKHRCARALDARSARTVQHFHALSAVSAEVMAGRLKLDRNAITVIPRGRDAEKLGRRNFDRREAARRSLGYDDVEVLILAAARHEPQKSLDVLLEGFAGAHSIDKTLRLAIAGREGSATKELEYKIAELDIADAVDLLGPRKDLPELLCAADLFVMPSRWEGFGSVLIEAMALEAPILASNISVFREVTRNGALATLFTVDDPNSLAEGIRSVLDHPDITYQQVVAAREAFEQEFDIETVARRHYALYQQVVMSLRLVDAG